jgi:hypothetical protein
MDCANKKKNLEVCNCSYSSCSKKGMCCECLQYHLRAKQLPACCFGPEAEKTYDRSIEHFVSLHRKK